LQYRVKNYHAKILENHLEVILPKIILENQRDFIQGRRIIDNIILVQESVHSSLKQKGKCMAIKIDLVNVFFKDRHDFLFAVMVKLGFDPSLI